ncbi:P1 family peptidase [Clostridium botulinum]|uniref:P1 family peptidase n=1 Tax=Clostridium botulinum TaxID=1491 RepID=UPI0004D52CE6|nr:P1 family peptidase [Clostridium botulinum]KEI05064.1 peptidase [Clostridium botulinum C/D str. BKT75002]KEI11908.1 peptidase [Clostridium botulinum C/D str. BKT2873]KGM93893.1 peptidase [Clostridium botulinum D str. CCUG 7971]KOC48842.1 peptidase [Clostridium botulinum]MCD3350372.1 P1 family peptidase [Clostridium botulinum D/C]
MENVNITDIEGIKIGHAQKLDGPTGCTVILCEKGAVGGVDVRGGAPGTRETDLLNPMNMVDKVHAILLTGGSAFGLDAASGIMEYLEENNVGFDVGVTKVPIVCGTALFDLVIGNHKIRPDKAMGYEACLNANNKKVMEGNVGAGTGATVGKVLGGEYAMKGGLGTYTLKVGELIVGAVVAVNCLGDVMEPKTGNVIAGVLNESKDGFRNTANIMISKYDNDKNLFNGNTTIGAIATNATLTKAEANKIASMAHNGYARSIYPVHTMYDGDTIFAMATGDVKADVNVVGLLASKVMEKAIVRAIKKADSICGYKCCKDIMNK